MRFSVDRLDHLVVTVRDVEIAAAWYQRVLGMEAQTYGPHLRTALFFGGQKINLRPAESTQQEWASGLHAGPGTQDLCFVVTVTIEEVIAHLHDLGVAIELGPVTRDGALGPVTCVSCRDPDGNLIEIATYA